jgi:hypothetical protein
MGRGRITRAYFSLPTHRILTSIQGKGKWPHDAGQALRQAMLEEELFIYSKLNTEDNRKLKRIVASLSAYIDRTGWDSAVEEIFMTKLLRKLNNLRIEMLNSREITRQGNGYRAAPDQDAALRTAEARMQMQRVLDLATDDEKEDLTFWVLALSTRERALRAIRHWMGMQEF